MRAIGKLAVVVLFFSASSGFAIDVFVNLGGRGCAPYSYNCAPQPIFYPPYSYAGFAPYYYYSAPYPFYRSGSSSGGSGGGYVRLGEEHEDFWKHHGGYEQASYSAASAPLWSEVPVVDRQSPLQVGDAESRIQHLDLEVKSIVATGGSAVYHLSDGRKVTAEQGVIIDISS